MIWNMPHIRLRGLSVDHTQKINAPLVKELSEIIGSPEDHFTFELVKTEFFVQGKVVSGNPFVEVLWFPRDQKIKDGCAKVITEKIKALGPEQDITIVFIEVSKKDYYENGKQF